MVATPKVQRSTKYVNVSERALFKAETRVRWFNLPCYPTSTASAEQSKGEFVNLVESSSRLKNGFVGKGLPVGL